MRVLRQKQRIHIAVACTTVLLASILIGCAEKKQARPASSVPVTVATAIQKDVPIEIRAIGSVEAQNAVQVKSMISGEITSVRFQEGQDVNKGALLFTIDKRQVDADLKRAEATLAKDLATAHNARAEARRYQELLKEGVVARQTTEQMLSAADAAEALVLADRASVENAKVQLHYSNIYAPISGRTGNLGIQLGNVVKANDTVSLVTINQLSPIYVTFTIPEQLLGQVKQAMAGRRLTVSATIPNDPQPALGTLTFVDNAVDKQTGTIKLKGTFDNKDRRLWPGQFSNITLTVGRDANAVVVPSVALQNGQQGPFVYVVKNDGTAESRQVAVTRTTGDQTVIGGGLSAGDVVVTDGQLRLTPGAKVEVQSRTPAQGKVDNPQGSRS